MINTKPRPKITVNEKRKTVSQSLKKSNIKSRAASRLSISTSRASTAASSSHGPSRCATVEESDDNDDNEASHIGGTLEKDGDVIMELADPEDSEPEQSEDEEMELSKSALYLNISFPLTLLFARTTY